MFDLAATLNSGQAFQWREADGGFFGMVDQQPVWLRQRGGELEIEATDRNAVERYLALDHDMEKIFSTFPSADSALEAAVAYSPGLRILRQPKWECLAAFITSSLKQVPHIAAISHTLRKRFGQQSAIREHEAWSYPGPEILASAGESALRDCGLGYRAKFLWQSACMIADGTVDLEKIVTQDDAEAEASLTRLPGVGPKIANCVLLFAYERMGAFPIDVWVERVLRVLYFPKKRTVTSRVLRDFALRHFGPCRGYAQQFLFHYARMTKLGNG